MGFRHLIVSAFAVFALVSCVASEPRTDCGQMMEAVRGKAEKLSELKGAMLSLDAFCAKNPDSKKRILQDLKQLLSAATNSIQKANLLASMIDSENLYRDQRQLRQWIDELTEILEENKLPQECRNQCLSAIGGKELLMRNFMEAEKIYSQLEEIYEEQKNDEQLVAVLDALEYVYLLQGDRKMFDHMYKKKIHGIKRLGSRSSSLAEVYSSSAMKFALLREWAYFDEMCERSVAADNGKELRQVIISLLFENMNAIVGRRIARQVALRELRNEMYSLWSQDDEEVFATRSRQIANNSRYVLNNENNYLVADFVRKASGGGFSLTEFNRMSQKLCGIGEKAVDGGSGKMDAAAPEGDRGVEFLIDLMMAEVKIHKGVPCVDVREKVKQLSPCPFEIMQTKFSTEDADALFLMTQLCVSQRLGDLTGSYALSQKLATDLGSTSKPFAVLLSNACHVRIAETWIDHGRVKDGYNLLFPLVEEEWKKLDWYTTTDIALFYNSGRACRRLGALGDAEKLLGVACRSVRNSRHNGSFSFYGADVCTEFAALLAAKKASQGEIDDLIDEAVKFALKGGYPDSLGRAYRAAMQNLFSNSEVSRKEKLVKIEKMKGDCLTATSNPALLASFFYTTAKFEYENNVSAKTIVREIEQYFQYQQLLAGLTETTSSSTRDSEMKEMLLTLLGEMDDVAGLDYWNKIFEKRKTRSVEMVSMAAVQDETSHVLLPLLSQIAKYEAAREILSREQAKPEESRDRALLAKATQIKRELERNFDEAQKTLSPENTRRLRDLLSDGFVIHPDSMGQLCSVLPEDVVCLQYLPVGDKIIVYLVASGATPFVTMIPLKDKGLTGKRLIANIVKLRSNIQHGVSGKSLEKDMKELYDVLFADIRSWMDDHKCRRVIVNSSGMLRYIPFAALYDGERYLVEKYQISNVTGLDLVRLAKTPPKRTVDSVRAMVFADPDGSLPHGQEEGRRVAGLFKNSQLLVGDKASIGNLESMLGNVNFIHLATHAVLDADNPKNSFILFAGGQRWRYCDMMGFCVENVDSIALSACSTAVGEKSSGGEIEGMAYQLLRKSPSGSVLASFWKVDDAATEKLMGIYYNHILASLKKRGSLDRGGALHEAQLSLLHDPATASPYYWAAFSLFGDFR